MIIFQITNCLAYKQSWRIFNLENSNKLSDTCTRSLVLLCVHQYSWKGILFAILFGKWGFFSKTLIFSICTFYFTAKQLLLNQLSKKREYKYVNFWIELIAQNLQRRSCTIGVFFGIIKKTMRILVCRQVVILDYVDFSFVSLY